MAICGKRKQWKDKIYDNLSNSSSNNDGDRPANGGDMNNEQLRKEFEALDKYKGCDLSRCSYAPDDYANTAMHHVWEGYQAAAQSRDELVKRLVDALDFALDVCTDSYENLIPADEDDIFKLSQALAEAKAQGYRE